MDNPEFVIQTIPKMSVVIIGGLNRKRNNLINAIIGKLIIPPALAILLRITYDLQPRAQVILNNGSMFNISVDEIVKYINSYVISQSAETIDEIIIYYPCQFCQKGIDIVNIPSCNGDINMVRFNEIMLSRLDETIMVINPEEPISEADCELVYKELTGNDSERLMFVINDIDVISPDERKYMAEAIKKRILMTALDKLSETYGSESEKYEEKKSKIEEYPFFLISSSNALDARINGNDELLVESGIQKFEDALAYILKERFENGERKK
ncbi:MAG: hypothetical protein NC419_03220 [Muribaculaceae bacterium]|nr:hypothetical protein [Muribaculaceae bacterium]